MGLCGLPIFHQNNTYSDSADVQSNTVTFESRIAEQAADKLIHTLRKSHLESIEY